MLYVCLGDGASSLNFLENNLQTTQSFLGTIFRIDPSGNNSPNGKYGIPSSNPFFNSTETDILKEIYAYGFRNPHRISWDTAGEQKMLVGDIGEKNMEEINLILPGRNYGWGKREGTFLYERILGRENIYELPSDDSLHNYAYPVAQYDHDEGLAVVGGYVYRRDDFPELYGQYIFGDIVSGILFHTNVEDLQLGKQAEIFKIATKGADGYGTSLLAEVNDSRADLRFGKDKEGHIYVLTKSDGKIRKILDPKVISNTSELNTEVVDWLSPNPSNGIFRLGTPSSKSKEMSVQVFNTLGKNCFTAENIHTKDYLDLTHLPKGAYWVHFLVNKQEYIQLVTIH
ncbi:MAG: PQQ-dependent sugar dehydrogenase [Bacteroidota bacterium]